MLSRNEEAKAGNVELKLSDFPPERITKYGDGYVVDCSGLGLFLLTQEEKSSLYTWLSGIRFLSNTV